MLVMVASNDRQEQGRAEVSTSARLVTCACQHFGVTLEQLRSPRRAGNLSRARWAIAHVLIDRVGWSLPRVGALLNKHHTSVLYGWRVSRQLQRIDSEFFDAVDLLEQQL